jgi:hypothetical protein
MDHPPFNAFLRNRRCGKANGRRSPDQTGSEEIASFHCYLPVTLRAHSALLFSHKGSPAPGVPLCDLPDGSHAPQSNILSRAKQMFRKKLSRPAKDLIYLQERLQTD